MKKTYVSSQGVTFVEKPDAGIKFLSGKDYVIHHWCIVGEPNLRCSKKLSPNLSDAVDEGQTIRVSGSTVTVYYRPFSGAWLKFLLIPSIKFKIVRWLYKDLFDRQLKQKGNRYGLRIIVRKERSSKRVVK